VECSDARVSTGEPPCSRDRRALLQAVLVIGVWH
jgi:hypothetical protein